MKCPLCKSLKTNHYRSEENYFCCETCDLVFLNPIKRLSSEAEKARYLTHNNDIDDVRYQNFVAPLVNEIKKNLPKGSSGLDFGAGTGPVGAKMLEKEGYNVSLFDPFFYNDRALLENKYDFIFSCEVVEHFYNPNIEFQRITNMLRPGGVFTIMTQMYDENTDFKTWHYSRDPTHVVFYSKKTFEWIKNNFNFLELSIVSDRIITLFK